MRRREFIAALGSWPLWPPISLAQTNVPIVGFLNSESPSGFAALRAAFVDGLKDAGYIEGENVRLEYRWAESNNSRLPQLAADLVKQKVAVIFANGPAALPAKNATKAIPVVFIAGSDPIAGGLVPSLSRPGGNVTGMSLFSGELGNKRLELMREIVPAAKTFGVLLNPANPRLEFDMTELKKYSEAHGHRVVFIRAGNDAEIDAAFRRLVESDVKVLLIASDPFFTTRVERLALLSSRHRIASSYAYREFVTAGGLASYGTDLPDIYRQAAQYVARILRGASPGELPVQQPRKYPLVINLKAAAALGIVVPQSILARADEVIE